MLKESQATGSAAVDNGADIGVADGDLIVVSSLTGREGLLGIYSWATGRKLLEKEAGASIIYDPRVVFNIGAGN